MRTRIVLLAFLTLAVFAAIHWQSKIGVVVAAIAALILSNLFYNELLILSIVIMAFPYGKVIFGFTFFPAYVVIPAIAASFVFQKFRAKQNPLVLNKPSALLYAVFVYAVIVTIIQARYVPYPDIDFGEYRSTIVNNPMFRGLFRLALIGIFIIFANAIAQYKYRERILRTHIMTATIICALGVALYMSNLVYPNQISSMWLATNSEVPRLKATLIEPIFFAAYILTVIPFTFFLGKNLFNRKLSWFFLIIQITALMLTLSRAAILALAVVVAYLVWKGLLAARFRPNFGMLVVCVLILIGGTVLVMSVDAVRTFLYEQIVSSFVPGGIKWWSTLSRLMSVQKAYCAFFKHPLLGIGWESFIYYAGAQQVRWISGTDQFHIFPEVGVFPVRILAELGIIGFAIFMSFVFLLYMHLNQPTAFKKALFCSFLALSVQLWFFSTITFPFLWFILGFMLSNDKSVKNYQLEAEA